MAKVARATEEPIDGHRWSDGRERGIGGALGMPADIVQPDHPWHDAIVSQGMAATDEYRAEVLVPAYRRTVRTKAMIEATAKQRRRDLRLIEEDQTDRTRRGGKMRPTVEREGKADLKRGVIEHYRDRNLITKGQEIAAQRLRSDYVVGHGGAVIGRLVSSYGDAPPPSPGGSFSPPYTAAEGRQEYSTAMQAVGQILSPILVHVVIDGKTAASWAEGRGKQGSGAAQDGMTTLRLGLDALAQHYRLTSKSD